MTHYTRRTTLECGCQFGGGDIAQPGYCNQHNQWSILDVSDELFDLIAACGRMGIEITSITFRTANNQGRHIKPEDIIGPNGCIRIREDDDE